MQFPQKNHNDYTTSQLKIHTSQLEKVRNELQVIGKNCQVNPLVKF